MDITKSKIQYLSPDKDKAKESDMHKCECGNNTFFIWYSDAYETSGICTKCKIATIVHDG